jgi:hypothetical protein
MSDIFIVPHSLLSHIVTIFSVQSPGYLTTPFACHYHNLVRNFRNVLKLVWCWELLISWCFLWRLTDSISLRISSLKIELLLFLFRWSEGEPGTGESFRTSMSGRTATAAAPICHNIGGALCVGNRCNSWVSSTFRFEASSVLSPETRWFLVQICSERYFVHVTWKHTLLMCLDLWSAQFEVTL